jgi:hypothetical protein
MANLALVTLFSSLQLQIVNAAKEVVTEGTI